MKFQKCNHILRAYSCSTDGSLALQHLSRTGPMFLRFSTLYTTIPHDKLKSRLFQVINDCFLNKNGTRKYKFLVIGKQDTYFVRNHSDCSHKYSEVDIKSMLGFLIDNISVKVCT